MDLGNPGRHLISGPTVDNTDRVRTQAHGSPRGIHGHISGTKDRHILTPYDGGIIFRKEIGLHEVGPGEILIGRINADEVFSGYVQKPRKPCTHAHIDRLVPLFKQFIRRDGPPHNHIAR